MHSIWDLREYFEERIESLANDIHDNNTIEILRKNLAEMEAKKDSQPNWIKRFIGFEEASKKRKIKQRALFDATREVLACRDKGSGESDFLKKTSKNCICLPTFDRVCEKLVDFR